MKGEQAFATHQGRLPKELAIAGIAVSGVSQFSPVGNAGQQLVTSRDLNRVVRILLILPCVSNSSDRYFPVRLLLGLNGRGKPPLICPRCSWENQRRGNEEHGEP
ncbi:MAG: hypothetical protein FWF12_10095 [Betaproteobacteria bacterium]|nr:hypothetical protein [Betaproteobacteria bacterium]